MMANEEQTYSSGDYTYQTYQDDKGLWHCDVPDYPGVEETARAPNDAINKAMGKINLLLKDEPEPSVPFWDRKEEEEEANVDGGDADADDSGDRELQEYRDTVIEFASQMLAKVEISRAIRHVDDLHRKTNDELMNEVHRCAVLLADKILVGEE